MAKTPSRNGSLVSYGPPENFYWRHERIVNSICALVLCALAVALGLHVFALPSASAAGTVLFNQPFHHNTVDGTAGSVTIPITPSGTNAVCLSAVGNAAANPIASCATSTDAQGSGVLRFTSATTSLAGGAFSSTSVPTAQGLDITFNAYQYGGIGGDGLSFALAAVDPANPLPPSALGPAGGSLGYSAFSAGTTGLSHGYLGVGFDAYGNFSAKFEGSGCTDPANIAARMPGQVVVRGPGNGSVGYCALLSSAATATSPALVLRAGTRAASRMPIEFAYNPSATAATTPSGLIVAAGNYVVTFTPVGGVARSLTGTLPVVPAGVYPASWVNSSGFPKQLTFGWAGSTGSVTDFHEIDNAVVTTLAPVSQLTVSQSVFAASSLAAGSSVTYTVVAGVTGATEHSPVTVVETLPAGVVPVAASGAGWVCGVPIGQKISCTVGANPFAGGTITVNALVTATAVTPTLLQSTSTAVASSSDASPATATTALGGTVPGAPTLVAVAPSSGPSGGDNDVVITGTGLSTATAIEIGTAAEFAAGTVKAVVPCSGGLPAGCFTITNDTSIDIPLMPSHAAGLVQVRVVTYGTSGTTAYTYIAGPAITVPTAPAAEVNVAFSDQLSVAGGTTPYTWAVSTGTIPPGLTLSTSTGLISGTPTTAGTSSFTVRVTDHSGQSDIATVNLTVTAGPSLAFAAPPIGWTHTVYGYTLTESGGIGPYAFSLATGTLPAGISLSPSGVLSGTPTATGTSSFTVLVTDANGRTASQATTLTVNAGVTTTFTAPPNADISTPYSTTLTASGGATPYAWSLNAGTLPPGLTLNAATGVLAGTPTTAGTSTFSVNVIDANAGISTASITLVVASALTLSAAAPPTADVNTPYTGSLTLAGGTGPYTWATTAGTLPTGLSINATTGAITGTPTTLGTTSFTVRVTDSLAQTVSKATSIIVVSTSIPVTTTAPATALVGATITYTFTLTNSGVAAGTGPQANVLDQLPPGVIATAASPGTGTASVTCVDFTTVAALPSTAGAKLRCVPVFPAPLAIGAAASFTITATAPSTAGLITNYASDNPAASSSANPANVGSTCVIAATLSCASAATTIMGPPTVAVSFSPTSMIVAGTSSLVITLTNPNAAAITGAAFTNAYPAGLVNASTPAVSTTCASGTATAAAATATLTLAGAVVPASGSCTVTVTVTAASAGAYTNTIVIGALTTTNAGSNVLAGSAALTVAAPPRLTQSVRALAGYLSGSTAVYTVTVSNTGAGPGTASITDVLPGSVALTSVTCTGTCSTSSTGSTAAGTLSIAAGASQTLTITALVTTTVFTYSSDSAVVTTTTAGCTQAVCGGGTATQYSLYVPHP
jgi:uncharacterized repeat protein (TIGR01451 family)